MNYKKLITSSFKKEAFKIYYAIDPDLESLVTEINKSPDITTLHSCQGHPDESYDVGNFYLTFNVSEKGWDIFWTKVLPELAQKRVLCYTIIQVPNKKNTDHYVGISIYCSYADDVMMRQERIIKFSKIFKKHFLSKESSVSLQSVKL